MNIIARDRCATPKKVWDTLRNLLGAFRKPLIAGMKNALVLISEFVYLYVPLS
jgi:hypothetical protein